MPDNKTYLRVLAQGELLALPDLRHAWPCFRPFFCIPGPSLLSACRSTTV